MVMTSHFVCRCYAYALLSFFGCLRALSMATCFGCTLGALRGLGSDIVSMTGAAVMGAFAIADIRSGGRTSPLGGTAAQMSASKIPAVAQAQSHRSCLAVTVSVTNQLSMYLG